jgi:hypothetical protein
VALRDHLRADEDAGVGVLETMQELGDAALVPGRVGVEPEHRHRRERFLQLDLQPLRPSAVPRDGCRAAVGTD